MSAEKQKWMRDDPGNDQLKRLEALCSDFWCAFAWDDTPQGYGYWYDVAAALRRMRDGLRAYQSRPKTQTVERWHVEYWTTTCGTVVTPCVSKAYAESRAQELGGAARCVRVTGPHMHEVPA